MPKPAAVRSRTVPHVSAPPPFVCSWRIGGSKAAWVRVAGELDIATSPRLRLSLKEAQDAAPLVVLDLRELRFIDSTGVHAILDAAGDMRRPGSELVIVRGPARVDRVLTLTEVDKQVAILDRFPPRADLSVEAI